MRIRVHYDDGREEEFDTSALTVAGVLGRTNAMSDFCLSAREDGLWAEATWYDVSAALQDAGVARRAPGCSIQLLSADELEHAQTVLSSDEVLFYRVGPDLLDMALFRRAMEFFFVPDDLARPSVAARAERLLQILEGVFPGKGQGELLAMMGITEASYQFLSGADANVDGGKVYFEEGWE